MNSVCLLDCTLRDGAYLVDKQFGDNTINGIVRGLINSKVDFVEIGFFQNDGFGDGKTVYRNSKDAKKYVPAKKGNTLFTVLADFSRYSIDNLDECMPDSVDAIRECFFKSEREEALEVCKIIKDKGYKLFVQPVDVLGYTDKELIDFIEKINEIEPYCFSIVDTFGSMYQEDLHRVFELVNHNLIETCKIGFHSHNNMQLSNALSQEFIRMSMGKREVVVDGTLAGMGRGAGNTPTELVMQYMVSKWGYNYDIDSILDLLDTYMDNIKSRCSWGYSTDYFLAGSYGAHVNNISYLTKKNSIRSKEIRFILNKIGASSRKRYDYNLLDKTYLEMMMADIDDTCALETLKKEIENRKILILVPGNSILENKDMINDYINENNPVVITVNFIPSEFHYDYLYISNKKRFEYWRNTKEFIEAKKIITSNFPVDLVDEYTLFVSFMRLIKCGWEAMDNSTIMLLRLMDIIGVEFISIAGFDGYSSNYVTKKSYVNDDLELLSPILNAADINREISEMLSDFILTKNTKNMKIEFITTSRFEKYVI